MYDYSGKVLLKNRKTWIVLSLLYLKIYHVIDVMHGIKKRKVKILADKLDKFSSKKKKKKKKKFKILR